MCDIVDVKEYRESLKNNREALKQLKNCLDEKLQQLQQVTEDEVSDSVSAQESG